MIISLQFATHVQHFSVKQVARRWNLYVLWFHRTFKNKFCALSFHGLYPFHREILLEIDKIIQYIVNQNILIYIFILIHLNQWSAIHTTKYNNFQKWVKQCKYEHSKQWYLHRGHNRHSNVNILVQKPRKMVVRKR